MNYSHNARPKKHRNVKLLFSKVNYLVLFLAHKNKGQLVQFILFYFIFENKLILYCY